MRNTSEWVSLGHPDKTADFIGSSILDALIKQDPNTRCGLEVQFKDNVVNLAGEITTKAQIDYAKVVRDAVGYVGYIPEYAELWGKENAPNCDDLVVHTYLSTQSSDISLGVDKQGWGDQGIYFGMATSKYEDDYMPYDYFLARQLGMELYSFAKFYEKRLGLDIKTMITVQGEDITDIVVAIPTLYDTLIQDVVLPKVENFWKAYQQNRPNIIINGTGAYVKHSSMGDSGVLGRKLVVDAYGGNCPIGGGAYWGKDGTKSDLTLNLYARKLALFFAKKYEQTCFTRLSGVIGKPEVAVDVLFDSGSPISSIMNRTPGELIQELELDKPNFKFMTEFGLFSRVQ